MFSKELRALNEPIARKANKEDKCSGRFWEGRFKSQALLDETAVLACMAYVDHSLLKDRPIRAKIADTPESSDFTSIQIRIKAALDGEQPANLLAFVGNEKLDMPKGLQFHLDDYLQLVDETGRLILNNQRNDKRGAISDAAMPILNRLNIPQENWLKLTTEFMRLFKGPVGSLQELDALARKRRQGAGNCHRWFDSA